MTPEADEIGAALKRFLRARVYFTPDLMAERARSAAMIGELFEWLLEDPGRLPESYRQDAAGEPPHRLVCDYLAGMTDGFFRRTYSQAIGGRAG